MKKQPHITEQTKKNLVYSFWQLYKTNDLNKITISNISKKANYERTTFYRYFIDINDILEYLENDIIENLKTSIKNRFEKTKGISIDRFKSFTGVYGEYIVVFHEKGNKSFYNKFKVFIKDTVYDYFNFNIKDENIKEFLFEFMFSSLINSFAYWYRNQNIMSLESFVLLLNGMLLNTAKIVESYEKKG